MIDTFLQKKKGYSLVEMIIYVFILTIILFAIVNTLFVISRSQRTLRASRAVENSGIFALERMVREVRNASDVNTASSTLSVSPGVLVLSGLDESGNQRTVKFSIVNGVIKLEENGVDMGALTQSSARVTSLLFRHLVSGNSEAVKIQMTVESGTSTSYKSNNFYSTVILRGSL